MKFKLKKSMYDILNEHVPDSIEYLLDIQEDEKIIFSIKNENVKEVQLLINDEIVSNGMDNQDTVNELGLKLYKLYDEILYQKNNQ